MHTINLRVLERRYQDMLAPRTVPRAASVPRPVPQEREPQAMRSVIRKAAEVVRQLPNLPISEVMSQVAWLQQYLDRHGQ